MTTTDAPDDNGAPAAVEGVLGPEQEQSDPGRRPSSRDTIMRTARRMFAEKGYAAVSIRDIAAAAGVSPALVIKHGGSKQQMFSDAITFEPLPLLLEAPLDQLGHDIARRIVTAHRTGRPSPLTRAVVLVLPSPDPDDLRARLDAAYLEPLTERLGGDASARRRAEAAMAAATGLSVSLRCFKHHADPAHDEELIRDYGRALQVLIDG